VRIWDEAILPAEPLTFTVKQFEEATVLLRELGQHSASALLADWVSKKLPLFYGSVIEMPLLILDLGWENLDKSKKDANLSNLIWMSGQGVRLHDDNFSGATIISYRDSLPKEFAPLLVLDASGSLRLSYGRKVAAILLS
jgi:hypothetical protein